jgi:SAM-dependent methyltransferase
MDLFVSQLIFKNQPLKHVDVGSRVDGFVAHVAAFRPIEIFDIRPIESKVENIKFIQADFMVQDSKLANYADSISCLHAIEHFGLGRYNDPIDVNGHKKGLENMYHVLQKGGKFYFATPMGPLRVEFNGHRVFSLKYLLDLFKDKYSIDSFSYVDDKGDLFKNVIISQAEIENNFNCNYGCAIFEMTKL